MLGILFLLVSSKPQDTNPDKLVLIKTRFGDMKVKLYNETPLHRDNFLKLAGERFYNELLFHRVIKNFMIQGGDPDSKGARPGKQLGGGDLGYLIPAEFNTGLIHKKGALAAARTGDEVNPEKKSSASQFYIVQGKTWTDEMLNQYEVKRKQQAIKVESDKLMKVWHSELKRLQREEKNDTLTFKLDSLRLEAEKNANLPALTLDSLTREIYKTLGGTPHLDGGYTVFGEVVEGLAIIDSIANVTTERGDRPVEDVKMWMEIIE
jgi:cyclophilin family peptidyl-prolyl cis-trans isomerase